MRGFEVAGGLLRDPIRKAGEARGFAVTRLLTHWTEVAGADLAPLCRPVKVSYSQGGFGGTLTLLASGAAAPLVQMQIEGLRQRVNAIYGHAAITRIRVTQTAAEGLAGGQGVFQDGATAAAAPPVTPQTRARVAGLTGDVADPGLRAALDRLATNVLTRTDKTGTAPRKGRATD